MYVFHLETKQKLPVPPTAIAIGVHNSKQVQVNKYLPTTTDIANQFSCRQFTFSVLRKDIQLVVRNNYPYAVASALFRLPAAHRK
jgi:hypothetical protein